jgi:RimJ/RimL family protein N-acetyltransferase
VNGRRGCQGRLRTVIERLETERMLLRPITMDDVDLLVALDSDPAVMRFINGGRPSTRAEVEDKIRRSLGHRWIARELATDEFLGWFGLRPRDETGANRSLGYRLRQTMWRRGLATEGSLALIELAFTRLGAERVSADTMGVNTASRLVMERCGLHYARTFHLEWDDPIEGTELGEVEYELTRAEWEAARRAIS